MKESMKDFKDKLRYLLEEYRVEYRDFSCDIIDYTDAHKDEICYYFLMNMETWHDDILPLCVVDRFEFIRELYTNSMGQSISHYLREAIYLSLENTLRDIVEDIYYELYPAKPEPFPGYERGQ